MSDGVSGDDVLDRPIWSALTGPHTSLAAVLGDARRYAPGVAALADVAPGSGDSAWADLRRLHGSDGHVVGFRTTSWVADPPPGWDVAVEFDGLQMVAGDAVVGGADPEAVPLGEADHPDMADLVARTEPGPFGPGALRMGRFLGVRRDGRLVAMAGERLHLPGWVEISAVCTDPSVRGEGLAGRLVGAVVAAVRDRDEQAFLHVANRNAGAVRLYERLRFSTRRTMWFAGLVPTAGSAPV